MNEEQLPPGWSWATVDELAESLDYGSSAKTSDATDGVPVLRMGNIVSGALLLDDLRYLPSAHPEFPNLLLRPGDVLFNRTNSPELVGKTAVYEGTPSPCSFASYLLRLRLTGIEPRLFTLYINSPPGRAWVASVVSQQVGQANVNSKKLRAFRVPVPPLNEQHRIVAKLETLLARGHRAKEILDAIPAMLERFRQSVLAAAFRGNLTRDWREANPDVEPASKLMERISVERRRCWEDAELKRGRASGKMPKDKGGKENYEESSETTTQLPGLPSSWTWATVRDLTRVDRPTCYGVVQPGSERDEGIPLVRVCDIEDGAISVESLRRITPEIEAAYERSRLEGGEVLVTVVGSIGRVAVAPESLRGANIARAVARMAPDRGIPARWMALWLSSPFMQDFLTREAREVARKTLNIGTLEGAPVPVAPVAEMDAVCRLVDAAIASSRDAERQVVMATGRAIELSNSLLARAFRGELVPQDPTDEPASVLLQRIRAERNKPADNEPGQHPKRRRETKVA